MSASLSPDRDHGTSDDSLPAATSLERRVLILPPTGADGRAMAKILGSCQISHLICVSAEQLSHEVHAGTATVVLSEEALLAGVPELMAAVADQPVWADLPIIVLSRSGRESPALSSIILELGNVSVVERPMRTSTLVSLVQSCLRTRERQYLMREYLAQQEKAQKAIQEGERRYRSLIENVTDYAIFMTDCEGRITTWNDGAEAILGYSAEQVLGRPVNIFCDEEDLAARISDREMGESAREGRATSSRWRLDNKGQRLYVEAVVALVRDDAQAAVGFAHFLRDVTARHRVEMERELLLESERAARSEAERASRTKDEFLATLSHELRTPLNAVLGWAQVLRRSPTLTEDIARGLATIERNARSQAQIIEDLLDMSSIISGKVRLDVQRLDLSKVVETTIETVRPSMHAKAIRLQVVLDPGAGPVRGDPGRLQQVLWNLLTNAVKFTPKGGRVTITLGRVNSHVEVEVSDNGEGIDPIFLPHIFDRFRQADASTTRRHGGLGLGLSIVKQLVELHGGTILAKSGGAGKGATFRIALPLMPLSDDPLEATRLVEHPTRTIYPPAIDGLDDIKLTGVSILVVDDEVDARMLIQRFLRDCDATVFTAASAAEAIQVVLREAPDVLVSDIGMPEEDGYSLIRRIRSMKDAKALVPAIALTAYARVEDRVRAIQAGYQLHLSKPVEPLELIAMVKSLANGSSPHDGNHDKAESISEPER